MPIWKVNHLPIEFLFLSYLYRQVGKLQETLANRYHKPIFLARLSLFKMKSNANTIYDGTTQLCNTNNNNSPPLSPEMLVETDSSNRSKSLRHFVTHH